MATAIAPAPQSLMGIGQALGLWPRVVVGRGQFPRGNVMVHDGC